MISIVWPGDCPVDQPYGCTTLVVEPVDPSCPDGHFHCGIDVGMDIGTPLLAARAGVVDYVGYGLLAIHADAGGHDWYVHIDRVAPGISAFSGNHIAQGQLVAYSGNKAPVGGFTTGPHLHFEVQAPGGWINLVLTSVDPVPILEGGMTNSEKRAHVRHAYNAGLGREPTEAEMGVWVPQIKDDGSNVDSVIAQIYDSAEGQLYKTNVNKAIAAAGGVPPDDDSAFALKTHTHTTGPAE